MLSMLYRSHSITQTFQDPGLSDYLVCYVRILTSGYLQANEEFYGAFVEGGRTIKEYCSQVRVVCCVWVAILSKRSKPANGSGYPWYILAIVCG